MSDPEKQLDKNRIFVSEAWLGVALGLVIMALALIAAIKNIP
ncbi:MAG: hypothetical protein V3S39_11440 [Thermodesulfobacteriota bacterium]